ncbi:MAG: hypothetical protein F6K40_38965 [Okeania sp. SIO3I5]|uniref:hypothetical protein n=1 Tax=Okeania sp. SIO3I5 TaxID=2607805 RepID=UPI0013B6D705|nr:hypothetical protein [Okeania sp. SIO3I5]NEQ41845.1 hypothetical protein [Okeania sp. SIO3I5]
MANIITLMPFSPVADMFTEHDLGKYCATLKAEPSGSYIACPPTATTFAFIGIDTPETENLLLSSEEGKDPDPDPDPDKDKGKVIHPETKNINSIATIHV